MLLSKVDHIQKPSLSLKFGFFLLVYGAPQSPPGRALPDTKCQKLLECVLTENSKLYLGKVYTEEQLAKLSKEEVEKLFNNYEAKLLGQMVKSLGKSVINMYSMGPCAALGISNQDALSEDLENNPFLNSALQRFTCELYYRFGSFLAPLSIGIITSRRYLYEGNKNGEQEGTSGMIATGGVGHPAIGGDGPCGPGVTQQPQERTAEQYWIVYSYRAARFLVWGWSHFRC